MSDDRLIDLVAALALAMSGYMSKLNAENWDLVDKAQTALMDFVKAQREPAMSDTVKSSDLAVEVRRGGDVIHAAFTNVTAQDNAGVNPVPDLLRMMANQIEDLCP